jgi:ribosome-binding factor A
LSSLHAFSRDAWVYFFVVPAGFKRVCIKGLGETFWMLPGGKLAMSRRRAKKVAVRIQEEVSELLLRRIKDPRIGFLTVTGVDVSPDLRRARVFYSVVGTEDDRRKAAEGLRKATGFIRRELAARLQLKFVPEICFEYDSSQEYAEKIESLFKAIRDEHP